MGQKELSLIRASDLRGFFMDCKKVILSIRGTQKGSDGEDHQIELITEGKFYEKDGVYFLEYEETELSGMAGTKTIIVVEMNRVSLVRQGTHHSHFVFEKGKKFINSYDTPFGSMEMGVYSTHVHSSFDENGGELDLQYQLDIGGSYASSNELFVSFKEDRRDVKLARKC